jgi:putative ABC transport system substrate-binding protein
MKRRTFIAGLGGATAWPLVARGQQPAMPIVGWLAAPPINASPALAFFRQGVADVGFVEGQNVAFEYRSAEFHAERFPSLANKLVQKQVSVIAAVSGLPAVNAARAATATIPIVFVVTTDPVPLGLVDSLNRPGGNLTGVMFLDTLILMKQFELMHELLPNEAPLGVLIDPNTEAADLEKSAATAGKTLARGIVIVHATSDQDFEKAFATVSRSRVAGLVVAYQPPFASRHVELAEMAARFKIPTMYGPADLATSGGLISYGASLSDVFRRAGNYAGKILVGATPADLPVEQPSKFELKINLKTAKALGLNVPASLLARADEVIE